MQRATFFLHMYGNVSLSVLKPIVSPHVWQRCRWWWFCVFIIL